MSDDLEEKKLSIPLKTVKSIVSSTVGDSIRVSKQYVALMQQCGNTFLGQLAMELAMEGEKNNVKTLGEEEVFKALKSLGFDKMADKVKEKLNDSANLPKKSIKRKRMLVIDEECVKRILNKEKE